jgi:tetratricopeptide (TPR) repeat protein
MSAEEFKAQGNAAFSEKRYPDAIEAFSKAIALDGTNHVLYSNRSAAYAGMKVNCSSVCPTCPPFCWNRQALTCNQQEPEGAVALATQPTPFPPPIHSASLQSK